MTITGRTTTMYLLHKSIFKITAQHQKECIINLWLERHKLVSSQTYFDTEIIFSREKIIFSEQFQEKGFMKLDFCYYKKRDKIYVQRSQNSPTDCRLGGWLRNFAALGEPQMFDNNSFGITIYLYENIRSSRSSTNLFLKKPSSKSHLLHYDTFYIPGKAFLTYRNYFVELHNCTL